MKTGLCRLVSDARGAAAVEFAVVCPFLFLLMLGLSDVGRLALKKMQVRYAATAGADYAVIKGFDATAISSAVAAATASTAVTASPSPSKFCGCPSTSGISVVTCPSTCSNGQTAGTYVTVSATTPFTAVFHPPLMDYPSAVVSSMTIRIQ